MKKYTKCFLCIVIYTIFYVAYDRKDNLKARSNKPKRCSNKSNRRPREHKRS